MKYSIVITSYNYANYITNCIDSCLSQNIDEDFEILIIDDGSSDNTRDILRNYITNSKIKIFFNSNMGIEASSNYGISKSKGEYIVRVDADDCLASNFLNECNKVIHSDPLTFFYSDYTVIDSQNNVINEISLPDFDKDEILQRGDFLATGTVYNKKSLLELGLYNENTKNSGLENYELIIKMLVNGFNGFHINKPLFYYRRHEANISEKKKESIINYGRKLFSENNLGSYRTNLNHPYKLVL